MTPCSAGKGFSVQQAPTLADAAANRAVTFRAEDLEEMSVPKMMHMKDPADRKAWLVGKLGPYEKQLRESAGNQRIPVQLLAAVIVNELMDIGKTDVLQERLRGVTWGSFGIAQIQVSTALKDDLIPDDPAFQLAKSLGLGSLYAKDHLRVPQYGIDAAAKEIRILIDRMKANRESVWLKQFGFDVNRAGDGQRIYDGFIEGSQEDKEMKLANMMAAAYNSPDIIIAKDPLRNYSVNAVPHGKNAAEMAKLLRAWDLFRPECP